MGWEWVPPVCTAVVAVTGIGAAVYQNRKQTTTALAVVRQQTEGQVAIAREERRQRRSEDAYSELLQAAGEVGEWAAVVPSAVQNKLFNELWWQTRPDLYFDRPAGQTMLAAYWSPAIRALLVEMRQAMDRLAGAAENVRHQQPTIEFGPMGRPSTHDRLLELAQDVLGIVLRIRDQVTAELSGERDGRVDE